MDSFPEQSHLPRLSDAHYCAEAYIHWTLSIKGRAVGWLTPHVHHSWQLVLLHGCARYQLVCPVYVLMPDHIHLLWIGLGPQADQSVAMEFLRKHLRQALAPYEWQRQAHDHVLRESERNRSAFGAVVSYLLENPVRASLTKEPSGYRYTGCIVPGYPDLNVFDQNYCELFWRIYHRLVKSV